MSSFKCAPNFSGIVTPSEEEVKIKIDYFQLLFNYLKLLGLDTKSMQDKYHVKFDSETFKVPNQKAFQHLCHFLFTKLDSRKAAETFRDIWPIFDKKQETTFRRKVQLWFEQLKKDDVELFQNQHINPSMFLGPGGEKFVRLFCMLCAHIMSKVVSEPLGSTPTFVNKNVTAKESKLPQHFQYQLIKENLLIISEEQIQIIQSFGNQYEEKCLLSKQLVKRHRLVCQHELSEGSNLSSLVKQNQMNDTQRKSLFDIYNNTTKTDILAEMQAKENCIDELMTDLLTLENRFDPAWEVIERVLAMKKNPLIIDGHKLVHQLPSEFLDTYQTAHSGTRMELQLKDGRYDFLPVLNLLLYAVPIASQLSSTLNFPPLEDELEKLNQMKESFTAREGVAEKLQQRWNDIAINQAEEIEQSLKKKVEMNSPMLLQSLTPLRSLMSPIPSEDIEDIQTPLALRAALGMTPVVVNGGARPKTRPAASRRPSIDPLQRCKEGHRFTNGHNGHNGLEKADSNRIKDKRRSQEVTNGHAIRTEVTRTNSLTPDLATKPSASKTSAGACLHPRLSTGRPSSLAASPVFERLMQSEVSIPVQQSRPKQTIPQRRSLPQAQSSTNSPFRLQGRSAAVLDHAAEAIVNDLVVLDSPIAPSTAIIDPNSSFEMSAFVSRNRILRSPDQLELVSNGGNSNMDLLRLLEVKLASPARRSSLPAGFLTPTAAASSRPSSLVNSPIIGTDWANEKGLLDASSASLIDDYLDF